MLLSILRIVGTILLLTVFAHARAAPPEGSAQSEMDRASAAAVAAKIDGPKAIPLGEQAVLNLPTAFSFIPQREAAAFLHAMGNQTDEGFYGIVIGEKMRGFVSVRFENAGYVKDDDAKDWNADELLQNLKDGTEAGNEERRQRGIPEFVVSGWVEKPAYDVATHRLVWSAELRDKIPPAGGDDTSGANYNTYQLGREGYISMNLVTRLADVNAQKPIAQELLAALQFNEGKRYTNFDSSTDKVAAYGLAALVGGIVAKKLGLLAMLGLVLAKFAKVILLAIAGVAIGIRKFFRRKTGA